MKLLGISGTLIGSKTLVVIKAALEEARENHLDLEIKLLNMKDYNIELCDERDPSLYNADTKKVVEMIEAADCFIIGTPIFHGSIPGALKNLFDLIPAHAFKNKVMGFIAAAGNDQHYLVIENQLKPIAGYFKSYVAPEYVFALSKDFNEKNEIVSLPLKEQIRDLVKEVYEITKFVKEKD